MKNLKIALKLALGFGIVLVLTAVVALVSYNGLNTVGKSAGIAADANRMISYTLDARRQEKNFALRGFEVWQGDTENSAQEMQSLVADFKKQIESTKA